MCFEMWRSFTNIYTFVFISKLWVHSIFIYSKAKADGKVIRKVCFMCRNINFDLFSICVNNRSPVEWSKILSSVMWLLFRFYHHSGHMTDGSDPHTVRSHKQYILDCCVDDIPPSQLSNIAEDPTAKGSNISRF